MASTLDETKEILGPTFISTQRLRQLLGLSTSAMVWGLYKGGYLPAPCSIIGRGRRPYYFWPLPQVLERLEIGRLYEPATAARLARARLRSDANRRKAEARRAVMARRQEKLAA
jgi:hypothetical protein